MAVAISTGVRNALASLQSVQSQSQVAQQHLATGKRVNSAVDNAVNFFTAAGLNDRSSQLSGLLDGMSNAVQTIQAASKGIDGITKLVQQLQSTVKQAQADAAANNASGIGTSLATAAQATAAGKSQKDAVLDMTLEGAVTAPAAGVAGALGVTANSDVTVTNGSSSFTFKTSSTMTVRDFVSKLNSSGLASASVDDQGRINVTATGSGTLQLDLDDAASGDMNSKIGFNASDANATGNEASDVIKSSTKTSSVRSNLIQQYNDLRTQIDQLAKDAGFNGTNLLQGNKLSVVFNEKTGNAQNKLDVQGQTLTADNLGLGKAASATSGTDVNFQSDSELATAADALTSALGSLRSTASSLGASLSVVQTRQDFTKSMIDTLSTGADNLVNADQNQEAATLLALQTRQQLSQTSLSLSNQADQGILRLF
jgi:flagellin